MPSIKYKKKTYAGATFPVLEMTKAEYDALPEAKKMDGTVYMITDDTGGWEAENSAYDNTQSGLTATNVQSALDEVVTSTIPNAVSNKSKVLVDRVSNIGTPYTFNLNSDGSGHGTFLVNVRRYGTESFDGVYWLGIISILRQGNTQKWGMSVIGSHNNSESDGYSVTMSGTVLTIASLSTGVNYAYLAITKLA